MNRVGLGLAERESDRIQVLASAGSSSAEARSFPQGEQGAREGRNSCFPEISEGPGVRWQKDH